MGGESVSLDQLLLSPIRLMTTTETLDLRGPVLQTGSYSTVDSTEKCMGSRCGQLVEHEGLSLALSTHVGSLYSQSSRVRDRSLELTGQAAWLTC